MLERNYEIPVEQDVIYAAYMVGFDRKDNLFRNDAHLAVTCTTYVRMGWPLPV